MPRKQLVVLVLAFAGSFFVIGIPFWQIPYSQVSLPNALWGPGLLVVAALAVIPRVFAGAGFWMTAMVVGAAVPAAVFARVIVEALADPTQHNLWPLELILAAGPGYLAAAVGALAGGLFVRRPPA